MFLIEWSEFFKLTLSQRHLNIVQNLQSTQLVSQLNIYSFSYYSARQKVEKRNKLDAIESFLIVSLTSDRLDAAANKTNVFFSTIDYSTFCGYYIQSAIVLTSCSVWFMKAFFSYFFRSRHIWTVLHRPTKTPKYNLYSTVVMTTDSFRLTRGAYYQLFLMLMYTKKEKMALRFDRCAAFIAGCNMIHNWFLQAADSISVILT